MIQFSIWARQIGEEWHIYRNTICLNPTFFRFDLKPSISVSESFLSAQPLGFLVKIWKAVQPTFTALATEF